MEYCQIFPERYELNLWYVGNWIAPHSSGKWWCSCEILIVGEDNFEGAVLDLNRPLYIQEFEMTTHNAGLQPGCNQLGLAKWCLLVTDVQYSTIQVTGGIMYSEDYFCYFWLNKRRIQIPKTNLTKWQNTKNQVFKSKLVHWILGKDIISKLEREGGIRTIVAMKYWIIIE